MLRSWCIKNTFINNVIPYSKNYLNNKFITQKTFDQIQKNSLNLFKIYKQKYNTYYDFFNLNDTKIYLNITEQDHLYPEPYSLVSTNFIHSTLQIKFKDTTINEIYNIKFNYPNDFEISVYYLLKINEDIEKQFAFTDSPNENFFYGIKHKKSTMNLLNLLSHKIYSKNNNYLHF